MISAAEFESIGFSKVSENEYTRTVQNTKINLILGDIDPEFGLYMEHFVNDRLYLSGYWTDIDDLKKTING